MNMIKKLGTMLITINKKPKFNFCKRSIVFHKKCDLVIHFSSLNLCIIMHYYKHELNTWICCNNYWITKLIFMILYLFVVY